MNHNVLSVQLEHLHGVYSATLDSEPQRRTYHMKTLNSSRPWIYHKHVPLYIPDDLENMGMTADKDVRFIFINQGTGSCVISSRISSEKRWRGWI